MHILKRIITIIALINLIAGCKHPTGAGPDSGGGLGPRIVSCASQEVQQSWPKILPSVNGCLVLLVAAQVTPCLLGLVKPAIGITEDVIACVVRGSGDRYADAATANRDDQVSARAAANAFEFIRQRGYQFSDGGGAR